MLAFSPVFSLLIKTSPSINDFISKMCVPKPIPNSCFNPLLIVLPKNKRNRLTSKPRVTPVIPLYIWSFHSISVSVVFFVIFFKEKYSAVNVHFLEKRQLKFTNNVVSLSLKFPLSSKLIIWLFEAPFTAICILLKEL